MGLLSKKLFKDKYSTIALIVLIILYLGIFFADFLAPYSKEFSDRHRAYAPPSKIFTINEKGKLSWPYTYNYKRYFDENTKSALLIPISNIEFLECQDVE